MPNLAQSFCQEVTAFEVLISSFHQIPPKINKLTYMFIIGLWRLGQGQTGSSEIGIGGISAPAREGGGCQASGPTHALIFDRPCLSDIFFKLLRCAGAEVRKCASALLFTRIYRYFLEFLQAWRAGSYIPVTSDIVSCKSAQVRMCVSAYIDRYRVRWCVCALVLWCAWAFDYQM